jgi:hypothetical protein
MAAKVTPLPHAERHYKNSPYKAMPHVPFRLMLTGRSGSGKTVTVSSLCLDHYRGCFEAIYIFSSTAFLDPTFIAIADYARQELGQGKTDDPNSTEFVYTTLSEPALLDIMERTKQSVEKQAKTKKVIKGSLLLIDDLSHTKELRNHGGSMIGRCFTTARHHGLSLLASTHAANSLGALARRQLDTLCCFSISNRLEMQSLIDQYSRLASKDPKIFEEIFRYAAGPGSPPFSFLTIHINSRDKDRTFMARFDEWIIPPDE